MRSANCARKQNEFVEDLNVRRNEELGRLQTTLLTEVQTYAKAQGFDLVIGDGVLYAKDYARHHARGAERSCKAPSRAGRRAAPAPAAEARRRRSPERR